MEKWMIGKKYINVLFLTVSTYSAYFVPIILMPILAARLGASSYGIVSTFLAIAAIVSVISEAGTSNYGVRAFSEINIAADVATRKFYSIIFIRIFCATLLIVAFYLKYIYYSKIYEIAYILPVMLSAYASAINTTWYFHGRDNLALSTAVASAFRLISIPLIYLLVSNSKDIVLTLLLISGMNFLASMTNIFFVKIDGLIKKLVICWSSIKSIAKESFPLAVSAAALAMFTNGPIVAIAAVVDSAQVAYFSVADKWVKLFHFGVQPFNQIIFRKSIVKNDAKFALNMVIMYFATACIYILFSLFFAEKILLSLFGELYIESFGYVKTIIFTLLITAPSAIFSACFLLAKGRNYSYGLIMVGMGLTSGLFYGFLAKNFGISGVMFGVYFLEASIFIIMILIVCLKGRRSDV